MMCAKSIKEKEDLIVGKNNFFMKAILLFFALVFIPAYLPAAEIGKGVQVTFLGHAAFKLVSPQGVTLLIDPFLKNNPKTPPAQKEVEKADFILVTHGHADHLGDALAWIPM
jgi:glyoxylase-like metal-dependent hydrolase (beta-lactamase superfamily II)